MSHVLSQIEQFLSELPNDKYPPVLHSKLKELLYNHSGDLSWYDDGMEFIEVIRQEYSNCVFSAGNVEGHSVDTMYLKIERGGHIDTFLLLRPDEMAVLGWLASGVLYSHHVSR